MNSLKLIQITSILKNFVLFSGLYQRRLSVLLHYRDPHRQMQIRMLFLKPVESTSLFVHSVRQQDLNTCWVSTVLAVVCTVACFSTSRYMIGSPFQSCHFPQKLCYCVIDLLLTARMIVI